MNKGGVSPKLKATMEKIENILRKEDHAFEIKGGRDGMMLVVLFFFARSIRHQNEANQRVIEVLSHQLVINKAQILLNDDIEKRLDGKEFS